MGGETAGTVLALDSAGRAWLHIVLGAIGAVGNQHSANPLDEIVVDPHVDQSF